MCVVLPSWGFQPPCCVSSNGFYHSWACRQSFFCFQLNTDKANGSRKWPISLVCGSKPPITITPYCLFTQNRSPVHVYVIVKSENSYIQSFAMDRTRKITSEEVSTKAYLNCKINYRKPSLPNRNDRVRGQIQSSLETEQQLPRLDNLLSSKMSFVSPDNVVLRRWHSEKIKFGNKRVESGQTSTTERERSWPLDS